MIEHHHTHAYSHFLPNPTEDHCLSRWGVCDAPVRIRPAPAIQGSSTSQDAARAIQPAAGTLRERVLRAIDNAGGLTDEEGCEILEMNPSTYRPRRVELEQDGLVRDSGRIRPTRAGRAAVVWVTRE